MSCFWTRALLVLAAACALRLIAAQKACPTVADYAFYNLQEAPGAYLIKTLNPSNGVPALAKACAATPRCNAFDTTGALFTVPMVPFFSNLDSGSPDVTACDGIYVARRTLSGLLLPTGVNVETMRQGALQKLKDSQALRTVVDKVSAKLAAKHLDPRSAISLPRGLVVEAFKEANVPLSQTSDTAGTYTFAGALAALSYPVWDSRTANGTTYNYISPVKDQGNCGSCVAFAATAAAEAAVGAVKNTNPNTNDFSEQWLFFCNGMYAPSCSTGWYGSQAANVLAAKNIPNEINYPYLAAPGCTLASSPEVRAGGNFTQKWYTDLALAKEHIRTYGAVMTYFAVYNDFFYWTATSRPYSWDGVSPLAGYHQVLVVGYNDTGSFWIVKNSWGTGWGDKGFFRISYTANVGFMSAANDNVIGVAWLSGVPPPPPPPSVCGDGTCAADESCSSCAADCGTCAICGDNVCNGAETCLTCKADCGFMASDGSLTCCGDGVCNAADGESCASCPSDCGACPTCNKNGICEPLSGEKCVSGTSGCSDCGTCSSSYCGDGKCTSARKGYTESCGTCPTDCGKCSDPLYCGDGVCSSSRNETTNTCSRDCSKTKLVRVAPGVSSGGNGKPAGRRSLI